MVRLKKICTSLIRQGLFTFNNITPLFAIPMPLPPSITLRYVCVRTREDENLCIGNVLRLFDVQYFAAHLRVQTPTRPSGDTALRKRAQV